MAKHVTAKNLKNIRSGMTLYLVSGLGAVTPIRVLGKRQTLGIFNRVRPCVTFLGNGQYILPSRWLFFSHREAIRRGAAQAAYIKSIVTNSKTKYEEI